MASTLTLQCLKSCTVRSLNKQNDSIQSWSHTSGCGRDVSGRDVPHSPLKRKEVSFMCTSCGLYFVLFSLLLSVQSAYSPENGTAIRPKGCCYSWICCPLSLAFEDTSNHWINLEFFQRKTKISRVKKNLYPLFSKKMY